MRPTKPTRVPAALDKLLALLEADEAFAEVEVIDGAPLKDPDVDDVLVIAPSSAQMAAVEVQYVAQPGLGRNAYEEVASIAATISSWSGDDEEAAVKPRRDRCTALLGALAALLGAHQVEADCWDAIGLGETAEWYQIRDEKGTTAAVGFYIVARSVI